MFSLHKYSMNRLIWNCVRKYYGSFKPIKMAYTVFDGENTDSSRPPVLILHGMLGTKKNWQSVGNNLKILTTRKVYTLDARNHGDSPHTKEYGPEHVAEDLLYLMQQLKIKKAALMGHSWGGRIVIYAALKYPELVECLVVADVSPVNLPVDEMKKMDKVMEAIQTVVIPNELSLMEGRNYAIEKMIEFEYAEEASDFVKTNLRKMSDGTFMWASNIKTLKIVFRESDNFMSSIAAFKPYQGNVLYICGNKSPYVNPKDVPLIKRIVPNAKFIWISGGHLLFFEKSAEIMKLLVDFLK